MPILRRQIRKQIRQSTPAALANSARRGSLDDFRLLTFTDLSGNVVGVITHETALGSFAQPEAEVRSTAPKTRAPLGIITLPRIEP